MCELCVLAQVPGSDLNAAIPFELIPKVTFDFRYDFRHFHMARAKSLQRLLLANTHMPTTHPSAHAHTQRFAQTPRAEGAFCLYSLSARISGAYKFCRYAWARQQQQQLQQQQPEKWQWQEQQQQKQQQRARQKRRNEAKIKLKVRNIKIIIQTLKSAHRLRPVSVRAYLCEHLIVYCVCVCERE